MTSRSTSATPGSGPRTAAFIALKIVVTAPLPNAITNTITTVKIGLFLSKRPGEPQVGEQTSTTTFSQP